MVLLLLLPLAVLPAPVMVAVPCATDELVLLPPPQAVTSASAINTVSLCHVFMHTSLPDKLRDNMMLEVKINCSQYMSAR